MSFKFEEHQEVEDITSVDESLHGYYAQGEDGKYRVKEELSAAAKAWDGIATANTAIRKENKTLRGKGVDLSPLGEYGKSVEEIKQAFEGRNKELQEALEKNKQVNPEKIRQEMAKGFAAERSGLEERSKSLETQLYTTLVTNEVTQAVVAEKGNAKLLPSFVEKHVKMRNVDGVLVTQVIDVDGEQRFGATGLPMTVRELVVTMKQDPDYASLFSSDVSRGSGPPPKRTAGKPQGQSKNAVSKIAAGLDALR